MSRTLDPVDVSWCETEVEEIKKIEMVLRNLKNRYLQAIEEGNNSLNEKVRWIDSMLEDLKRAKARAILYLDRPNGEV